MKKCMGAKPPIYAHKCFESNVREYIVGYEIIQVHSSTPFQKSNAQFKNKRVAKKTRI